MSADEPTEEPPPEPASEDLPPEPEVISDSAAELPPEPEISTEESLPGPESASSPPEDSPPDLEPLAPPDDSSPDSETIFPNSETPQPDLVITDSSSITEPQTDLIITDSSSIEGPQTDLLVTDSESETVLPNSEQSQPDRIITDSSSIEGPQPDRIITDSSSNPIENIGRRCQTPLLRRIGPRPEYCQTPPQADSVLKVRSVTSRSFERSQTPSVIFHPNEMYYRERDGLERERKLQFENELLKRYRLQMARSPYRYEMVKHRDECQRKFKRDVEEYEHAMMRERHRKMMKYKVAVREEIEQQSHLVKKDFFVPPHLAYRILAV
jgi:hypothetical protein